MFSQLNQVRIDLAALPGYPPGYPATVEATLNDPLSLTDLLPSGQDGRRPELWK
jgi:hypothetical protein